MAFEDLPKRVQETILRNKKRKQEAILRRREKRKKETIKRNEKKKLEREKERERKKKRTIARKKKRIYDRKRYREKKREMKNRKKTPEEILELKREGGRKSMAIMRERSIKVRKKKARENAKIREHQKEIERRKRQRHKEALKRQKEKKLLKQKERERIAREKLREKERLKLVAKKQREKERAKKKLAVKRAKQMTGNDYATLPYIVFFAHNKKFSKKRSLTIGKYKTIDEAKNKIKECLAEDAKIVFERQYSTYTDMENIVIDEYLLCRKYYPKSDKKEPGEAWLKNQYGKLVPHKISGLENVFIIDKFPTKREETVYVVGYDRLKDRKSFLWVCENLMYGDLENNDLRRIYLYKNKIIIRDDDDTIEIIVLKKIDDAIRFYNLLQKYCKGSRFLYMGSVTTNSAMWSKLEELIIEKTGWSRDYIWRTKSRKG